MSKKHKQTVQKQFTRTADAFAKFAVRDSPDVLAEKVEFAKPQPHELVLDVACGPGAFVLAVAPRVSFATGVDLTPEMLHQARQFQAEKQIGNTVFACADADYLPFPDASFDLVTCQHAFHHMTKPQLVLLEMMRVMKPQGRLLILDPLAPESDSKFELFNQIERLRDPSHTSSPLFASPASSACSRSMGSTYFGSRSGDGHAPSINGCGAPASSRARSATPRRENKWKNPCPEIKPASPRESMVTIFRLSITRGCSWRDAFRQIASSYRQRAQS